MNSAENEFKVTQMITAGNTGHLASYDDEFKLIEANAAGQYLAYLDMLDTHHPKGGLLFVGYWALSQTGRKNCPKRSLS